MKPAARRKSSAKVRMYSCKAESPPSVEEGRRQEAEGRREDCRGIQTRQQSNTAKTKFGRGLKPLLPTVVAEGKVQSSSASCPLPSAFLDNQELL